jgi:hypothetical protein
LLGNSLLALGLLGASGQASAHALGTDPTLIERLEAGATLPTELASTWSVWLIFALLASQNLPRVGFLFAGLAVGALFGALTWGLPTLAPALLLVMLLGMALWMTVGRDTPGLLGLILIAVATLSAINILLHVHADLADDALIRFMAALFTLVGASFCGGVLKQVVSWLPKQAPIGLRILSSWMVALLAIQLAAGSLT